MKKSFEQAMQRLEEIAEILQSGEQGLEESLTLFEEGNQLVNLCEDQLNQAETRLQVLTQNGDLEPLTD